MCIRDRQNVSLKAIFFSSMTNPATRFVNNIVYGGVGLVGAIYAVAGGITIGQLSIFLVRSRSQGLRQTPPDQDQPPSRDP